MSWRRVFETLAESADLFGVTHLERKCGFPVGHLKKTRLTIETLERVGIVTGWELSEIVALYELERMSLAGFEAEVSPEPEEEEEHVHVASIAS